MVQQEDSIERQPQGNKDANSDWAKERHCFVVQMLVPLSPYWDLSKFLLVDGSDQACFGQRNLMPM